MGKRYLRLCFQIWVTTGVFTLWIIGSNIVVQIDMERAFEDINFERRMTNLTKHIDIFCLKKEKKEIIKLSSIFSETESPLIRAKREKLVRDNLVYFPQLGQMWCLVPKAASTSWSISILKRLNKNFLTLYQDKSSNLTKTPIQVLLKENFSRVNKLVYEDAVKSERISKILLVRHPFARVASAYEEKLKNRKKKPDGKYFFQHYGVKINRSFRKNLKNKQKEPTFEEFIDYLIKTDPMEYDEHWQPVNLLCGLCNIRFDHVIKVEDLKSSQMFHLRKLGYVDEDRIPHENKCLKNSEFTYFRNISRSKMVLLYKKFEEDFQLFKYNFFDFYTKE